MVRWLLLALIAGCGFSIEMGGPVVGDDQPPGQPDAGATTARMCSTTDPALALCIDFDDSTNLAADQLGHVVDAQNLTPMPRAQEMAVELDNTSRLHVGETNDLDIADNLTVSMWISVDLDGLPVSTTNSRWLYDNNTQYFAQLRLGGIVRCGAGGEDVDSAPIIADGRWHHVTCTYTRDELRVYVDGHLHGCEGVSDRPLATSGMDGFAIGANVSGSTGPGGPRFTDQFIGGIDNVQVFSRLLHAGEICTAANGSGCLATCPTNR